MTISPDPPSGAPHRFRSYSAGFRRILSLAAVLTGVLPAAVVFFEFLPAYGLQAKFLMFYGPLVCLLALAYLFYIRDGLARAMFADLLEPTPDPDPYYGEPLRQSSRRFLRRLRAIFLAVLPIVLLLVSAYCAVEYLQLVNRSVGEATEQKRREPHDSIVGRGQALRDTLAPRASRTQRRLLNKTSRRDTSHPPIPGSDTTRKEVLRSTAIDDIPHFLRLNLLYIGIFLSAEVAFVLMALREYAREALGLTERDVIIGSAGG